MFWDNHDQTDLGRGLFLSESEVVTRFCVTTFCPTNPCSGFLRWDNAKSISSAQYLHLWSFQSGILTYVCSSHRVGWTKTPSAMNDEWPHDRWSYATGAAQGIQYKEILSRVWDVIFHGNFFIHKRLGWRASRSLENHWASFQHNNKNIALRQLTQIWYTCVLSTQQQATQKCTSTLNIYVEYLLLSTCFYLLELWVLNSQRCGWRMVPDERACAASR